MARKKSKAVQTDLIRLNEMCAGVAPGGLPRAEIMEFFGFEECGKTTLAIELSKSFKKVYMIDYEYKFDFDYSKMIGGNFAKIVQPVTFEEGVDDFISEIRELHKKGKPLYDCLIVDTIGSSVSEAEIEAELKENTMGIRAQKVTLFLKKAEKILKPFGVTTILLNHKKDKMGGGFGEQYYTPGGRQIKFSCILRVSVTKKKCKIYDDGMIMNMWIKKNQFAQEHGAQNCQYIIRRGKGICRGVEMMEIGQEAGLIKKEGQMYKIGSKEFRGKAKMIEFLDEQPKVREAIAKAYYEKVSNGK